MGRLLKAIPLILLILSFATVTTTVQSQEASPATSSRVMVIQGELTKVDTTNQTLTIKTERDEEMLFQYDKSTVVEGSENGIQGLSADSNTRLTVHFKEDSGKRIATKIQIIKSEK